MTPAVDLTTLPTTAQRILDPAGPAPMRAMAAKGIIPGLKPGEVVTVLALLSEWPDPALAETARKTLGNLPKPVLDGALAAEMPAGVVDAMADAYIKNEEVIGHLLESKTITPETVAHIAAKGTESMCEHIATNEARMLEHQIIIEALYMSKATRMSTADRVLELAVRNGLTLNIPAFKEAAAAIQMELIPEPSAEPTYDDILYKQAEQLAESVVLDLLNEDTHVLTEEGVEQVGDKCKPIWVQLAQMTVTQKIRRAQLGSSAERMMLVRDTNRLVASAAIRSPLMQEPEVIRISSSRAIDEDILRTIANNREWTRSYQIKLNLVMNPRCPFMFAAKMIPLLRESDLKAIAKSKNVSGSVATAARQHLQRKGQKAGGH
jgi:hypothetical protein